MIVKISQKGWVVIPAELRKKYDLKPGVEIHVIDYGGVLALIPAAEAPLEYASGMLKGDPSLVQMLLTEREQERARGK